VTDEELYAEARGWVMDCVGDPENVSDAPDHLVRRAVDKLYEGGWAAFAAEAARTAGEPVPGGGAS
jgi:hypothetical protein